MELDMVIIMVWDLEKIGNLINIIYGDNDLIIKFCF